MTTTDARSLPCSMSSSAAPAGCRPCSDAFHPSALLSLFRSDSSCAAADASSAHAAPCVSHVREWRVRDLIPDINIGRGVECATHQIPEGLGGSPASCLARRLATGHQGTPTGLQASAKGHRPGHGGEHRLEDGCRLAVGSQVARTLRKAPGPKTR